MSGIKDVETQGEKGAREKSKEVRRRLTFVSSMGYTRKLKVGGEVKKGCRPEWRECGKQGRWYIKAVGKCWTFDKFLSRFLD